MQELIYLKSKLGSFPWLLGGDFNVIRFHQEKWGKSGFSCYELYHTWSNKQSGDDFVSKKLDRVMANLEWLTVFVNTSVKFLEGGVSDHSPALVAVEEYISYGPKPFKIFNFWADHPQFLDWIKES
jgi:hypothetical protein